MLAHLERSRPFIRWLRAPAKLLQERKVMTIVRHRKTFVESCRGMHADLDYLRHLFGLRYNVIVGPVLITFQSLFSKASCIQVLDAKEFNRKRHMEYVSVYLRIIKIAYMKKNLRNFLINFNLK